MQRIVYILVQLAGENEKPCKLIELKERYVVVPQSGEFYLSHISPKDGKGCTVAKGTHDFMKQSDLKENLIIAGADGTDSLTGTKNGAFEEHLNRRF